MLEKSGNARRIRINRETIFTKVETHNKKREL
jgi:hypothetical protein